jgi:hypothetical protein
MKNDSKIFLLRVIHSLFAAYFISCLLYLYYAAATSSFGLLLAVAFISLAVEGFVVYILNDGDCPLAHIQKRLRDEKPFFELFFPQKFSRNAFKIFSLFTWGGVLLLAIRLLSN